MSIEYGKSSQQEGERQQPVPVDGIAELTVKIDALVQEIRNYRTDLDLHARTTAMETEMKFVNKLIMGVGGAAGLGVVGHVVNLATG